MSITENYRRLREEVPEEVTIVLAAKTRSPEEVLEAIEAGATDFGMNYVQEAETVLAGLGDDARRVRWHMIGNLQKNKINKALPLFDVVQTVDSLKKAKAIDQRAEAAGKTVVPVLLEINIGDEDAKAGLKPGEHDSFAEFLSGLVREVSELSHLALEGLMTMAPFYGDPEACRPWFRKARELYDHLRERNIPGANLTHLSMGMSDSWRAAVEEGSNMIRVGTAVFGGR